ncbi:MAG: type II toxin-antitoxin system VapC family toxin [Candidatus Omnitrophica bacterium]|nr:type II toxin-antitoxin system VapC family toxin [Candidatus Omnitrophota bacterium]
MTSVFVDSNIFIYTAGTAHEHKEPCIQFLTQIAKGSVHAVTSCEVLQEIIYRYWRIKEQTLGMRIVEHITALIPAILPVTRTDILRTKELLVQYPAITPRDALHAAVMLHHSIPTICSYDKHFDRINSITRITPQA